jgi:hypothetical protein
MRGIQPANDLRLGVALRNSTYGESGLCLESWNCMIDHITRTGQLDGITMYSVPGIVAFEPGFDGPLLSASSHDFYLRGIFAYLPR